ncbi:hypothetical protein IW140_005868 [Coemansia sp. RSA 1813]|nr:hypothetical protein EV178_005955 [Coemansia sp. RSA 1646]KAJ2086134.1 hypothetical protein IW138_005888 [Coemansia sp. RSA 986]KAJ2210891.1 hypothetical protein EV179_005914 [Coemansia sp. RSA 487]KAJ2564087.1 hypothetical protein IW140_005868 [Coemansia sp. RSA 1813]
MNVHQPRLQTLAKLIPPLTYNMHKGDCGRVAVIGGCEEYTGAPYFVASSSLRLGTDIAYLICDRDAGTAIKSYTPDIIVLPYLLRSSTKQDAVVADVVGKIESVLKKVHAISVGSGLGKNDALQEYAARAISEARRNAIPVVLDADSLDIVCRDPTVISGYSNAVLTPNPPEFARLCKAVGIDPDNPSDGKADPSVKKDNISNATLLLARKLGGVTIIRKGASDVISNGDRVFVCDEAGGLRRCGGQGDVLSGATVTFLAWGQKYKMSKSASKSVTNDKASDGKKQSSSSSSSSSPSSSTDGIDPKDIPMLASYAACMLTRHASYLAYDEYGRATQSSNILEQIDISFDNKFEELLKAVRPANL